MIVRTAGEENGSWDSLHGLPNQIQGSMMFPVAVSVTCFFPLHAGILVRQKRHDVAFTAYKPFSSSEPCSRSLPSVLETRGSGGFLGCSVRTAFSSSLSLCSSLNTGPPVLLPFPLVFGQELPELSGLAKAQAGFELLENLLLQLLSA